VAAAFDTGTGLTIASNGERNGSLIARWSWIGFTVGRFCSRIEWVSRGRKKSYVNGHTAAT
jgi:hypothetical protein